MIVERAGRGTIWLVVPIAMVFGGCTDMGVEPWPADPSGNIVTILDSGFELTAAWRPASGTTGLLVRGFVKFVSRSPRVQMVSYTLQYEYMTTEVDAGSATVLQYRQESLDIRDDIQNFVPLSSRPLKELRIKFLTKKDGIDSLFTVRVAVQAACTVMEGCEPGLRKLYEGPDLITGQIVWAHNSQSFYISVWRDFTGKICQYRFADGLLYELTPSNRSLAVRDESSDGRYLLVSDNNGMPSGLYTLDLETLRLQLLVPPHDSATITSARLSPDGKKIAFTSDRPVNGVYVTSMWLFSRTDSTISRLLPNAFYYGPVLTDWNVYDELVYHSYGVELTMLSAATLAQRRVMYSYLFYPEQLLSDHSTVAGILISDVQSTMIVEKHLALFDLTGKPVRQLTFAREVIFDYSVSPDRSKVVFITYRDNQKSLQLYFLPIIPPQLGKKNVQTPVPGY